MLTLVLLLDGILSDVFSDEEALVFVVLGMRLVLSTVLRFQLLLLLFGDETHLLMVWRSENILVLGLSGELRREDLALDVAIGSNV